MMRSIKIEMAGEKANLYTPYNSEFVKAIKGVGGARWNRDKRAWTIPAESIDVAREIMERIYGESDVTTGNMVTIRIKAKESMDAWHDGIYAFGVSLAHASGRDSGARVGENAMLVEGNIDSDGSVKNWTTYVGEGAIFQITIPESKFEACKKEEEEWWEITTMQQGKEERRTSLIQEREKLLNRVKEIEKELADLGD